MSTASLVGRPRPSGTPTTSLDRGDYVKRTSLNFQPQDWWVGLTPTGVQATFVDLPVTEHDDGVISVGVPFEARDPSGETWRGYLERGTWRQY